MKCAVCSTHSEDFYYGEILNESKNQKPLDWSVSIGWRSVPNLEYAL